MNWREFQKVADAWCRQQGEDDLVWACFPWGGVEHLVHEFSHAIHLGLDPASPDLRQLLGHLLRDDAYPCKDLQLKQEEYALVTEYYVCQSLGIPLEEGDIQDMAEAQGIGWLVNIYDPLCEEAAERVLESMAIVLLENELPSTA